MESAHITHADVQNFKQRHFVLTKSDKQYVFVVMYFVDI